MEHTPQNTDGHNDRTGISRRRFIEISGTTFLVAALGCSGKEKGQFLKHNFPEAAKADLLKIKIPPSKGYLLVDVKKCQGCLTCMLVCSLAHEGKENLSLSRIQIRQDPFEKFPFDITIGQCRQCLEPACIEACPTKALHVDEKNGNIRTVDTDKCIGCLACLESCRYDPGRMIWNFEEKRAQKCDLCSNTPYWNTQGGVGGKQICVEMCPVGALKFVNHIPLQEGNSGYQVNLRGEAWAKLNYSVE